MIYFFYGTDTDKARARARGVIAVMKKKRAGAEYFRITADNFNASFFEGLIGSQGLFERKCIVFADGVLENPEVKSWLAERTGEIAKSENAFVFLERAVDVATLKKFENGAQEIKKFDAEVAGFGGFAKRDFNTFALSDALGARDKKQLWSLLCDAFMRGFTPEEINGVLFWQVKAMIASAQAGNVSASGLNPFVYSKSRRFASSFKQEELVALSRALVSLYHDSHRGLRDFASGLERFVLTI